jgi:hypothetical protein
MAFSSSFAKHVSQPKQELWNVFEYMLDLEDGHLSEPCTKMLPPPEATADYPGHVDKRARSMKPKITDKLPPPDTDTAVSLVSTTTTNGQNGQPSKNDLGGTRRQQKQLTARTYARACGSCEGCLTDVCNECWMCKRHNGRGCGCVFRACDQFSELTQKTRFADAMGILKKLENTESEKGQSNGGHHPPSLGDSISVVSELSGLDEDRCSLVTSNTSYSSSTESEERPLFSKLEVGARCLVRRRMNNVSMWGRIRQVSVDGKKKLFSVRCLLRKQRLIVRTWYF